MVSHASAINPRNFWFWFGGIWLGVGLPFLLLGAFFAWNELTLESRLVRAGQRAQGMVLVKSWGNGSDSRHPNFRVQYRFTTAAGKTVRSEATVSEPAWEALREREAIIVPATVLERHFVPADRTENPSTRYRIRYRYTLDAAQPQELAEEVDVERWEALAPGRQFDLAVLPGEGARPRGSGLAEMIGVAVLVVMGAIFVPLGWLLGVSRVRRALSRVRVYWRGAEARGEVLEVVDTGTAINRMPMSRMRFRFTDLRGVTHEGATGLLSPAEADSLEPGCTGLVRYDMADPGISVWVDQGGDAK